MKPPKLFLRTRIFLSMIFLVLISFLLTGIVTNYQIRESSDYYHGLRLERKEAQIQRALRSLLEERSLLEDNQLSFLFNQRPEQNISINTVLDSILTNEIVKISEIQNINFTLYDIDGSLIGSTVSDEETESLSNQVLTDLEKSEDSKIVITKSGDETLLRSSFSYIFNINEKPIWILNFPYIDDDRLNTYEINSYILNLVQVYFLLFVLAIMISYLVSSYITNPISALIFKMKQMRLDKINKKIDLKVNSKEMYSLVNSYNNMVTQIDNNVKKLSKSQRELAWREMAKQVAHEIKNPLTPMKLSVQNFKLKFDPNDPKMISKVNEFSKTIIQQIDVLSSISTAFSNFADLPTQKNEKIDLVKTIKLALEIFNDKNIIYEPREEIIEVIIDRTSLIRIITNLVKNSIQATKSLETPSIKVSVYQNDKNAIIDVSDNGEGIPSNLKAKIFEPRFTTKSKGMGLGLSIINNLVTAHSGKITFTSKKGKTNFRVSFPKISKKD